MSSAIIGVAGLAISAGTAAYGISQQNKAKKEAAAGGGASATAGIPFGEKPQAAEYKPVDFSQEQWDTIDSNYKSLFRNQELMNWNNNLLDQDAMRRASKFIPNFKQNLAIEGRNATSLLNGQLPFDDVLDITANRSGLNNALGTPGAGFGATTRDLGISELSAMQSGAGLLQQMVQQAEQVNPINRRYNTKDAYINPTDAIKLRMEQNQLVQQSDQNMYNIEAGLSPGQQAASSAELTSRLAGGGASGQQDYSGYAQALQGLLGGVGRYAGGGGAMGGPQPLGTYAGSFASNPVSGVQNQIYRPPTSIPV